MSTRVGTTLSRYVATLALALSATASQAQQMRIQFAEKVEIAAAPGHVEFDAYGRRFSLDLESNDRLLSKLPPARKARLSGTRFLRGKIVGVADSWVRLAAIDGKLEGAIWDGREMYAVSSLADAAPHLGLPLGGAPTDTVVYRLSDTINLLPTRYCGVSADAQTAEGRNGLVQYKAMLGEIAQSAAAAVISYEQLDVALIADTGFQQTTTDAAAAMLARLNTADGIFGAQLGLLLNAAEIRSITAGADPFTQTDPDLLLDQVKTYRNAAPQIPVSRIAHLVTARNLANDVLGIATIDSVCRNDAVSLSVGTLGSFASGLIMAHELAHNLGAVHDGTGVCAGETNDWLMAPNYNGSSRFSQCSINTLQPKIGGAACIGPVSIADVLPVLAAPPLVQRDVPFVMTFTLQSAGALTAQNATAVFTLPGDVLVDSLAPSAGTCTTTAPPTCSFGDIASGDQRTVTLTARATTETAQRIVTVAAAATNDRVPENNGAFAEFAVVNNADASVSVTPGVANVRVDDPVQYTITVQALRSKPTRNIRVSDSVIGLRNLNFIPSVGTCTVFGDCSLGDLAPGTSATIVVSGIANDVGDRNQDIRLESLDDTNGSNNFATFRLTIAPLVNVSVDRPNQDSLQVGVGEDVAVPFTLRNSLGTQAASNVTVTLFADAWAPIQTAAIAGGNCVIDSPSKATCTAGSLASGEARVISVGIRGSIVGQGSVTARAAATRDDSSADNEAHVNVFVRNAVDLRLQTPFWVERVERKSVIETVSMYSNSLVGATDFMLTVELATDAHLTSLTMPDTACTIVDPRHGRCTAATLAHQPTRTVSIGAVGDTPGVKEVKVAISAATEADTTDNQVTFDMSVAPFTDVGVTPYTLPEVLKLGQSYTFDTHLRTAYRDVSNVVFTIAYPVEMEVTPPADLTGCTLRHDISHISDSLDCALPFVSANTDRTLTFQARPIATNLGGRIYVQAISSPDYDSSNNEYDQVVRLTEDSDLVVDVASGTATGTAGSTFALPRITLRSPRDTVNMVVKVPIPSFATIAHVSSGWICSGTTVLECNVFALTAGTETTFDITLRANSAGTFTSKVDVSAANDPNLANNTCDIVITVAAAPTGGSGSSSGGSSSGGASASGGSSKGGGGRMEWWGLAILGLLAMRRLRRRSALTHPACTIRH